MPTENLPYIPEYITVHLGKPDQPAQNIQVSFPDYIKNVASSEIYPTWPENAIRANVYAQISYALNRIYTEHYRSKGYDFDITNSTQFDQAFVPGRDIFENISNIVDDIFNDYVTKGSGVEPYFTQFCNGTTVKCEGLSQWGSVDLAKKGYTPYEILTTYYGNDINIVQNAPVQANIPTYPGKTLRVGDAGNDVKTIQVQLNRIANNYPAIKKIYPTDGIYRQSTADSVSEFQKIFNLPQTGEVNKATWYQIKYIYNGVKQLGELASEGLSLEEVRVPYPKLLKEGVTGPGVRILQYYLDVVSYFNPAVPTVKIDGYFGPKTTEAVKAFQTAYGLTPDGIVGRATWDTLVEVYVEMIQNVLPSIQPGKSKPYPGYFLSKGARGQNVTDLQTYLSLVGKTYTNIPEIPVTGYYGDQTENAVKVFQQEFGIPVTGSVGPLTWVAIAKEYDEIRLSQMS